MRYSDDANVPKFFETVYLNYGNEYPSGFQLFTGLKDKNGKEIYVGDIVIWNDGGGETELNPKKGWIRKAIVKLDPSLNFELTSDTPSGTPFHQFHYGNFIYKDTKNHLKVIGNIYSNPELLTP